jgi:hypothetical protein
MHQTVTLRLQRCNLYQVVTSKFMTAVNMNNAVLWMLEPCSLVCTLLRNIHIYLRNYMESLPLILLNSYNTVERNK